MEEKIDLSVILPVFNEEKNVPLVAEKYKQISKENNIELIFVEDGGSSDNTRKEMKKVAVKYKFIKNIFISEKGYGVSISKGMKSAKGEFVCWTHADLQTNPKDTIRALKIAKSQEIPFKSYIKGKRYGRPLSDSFFTLGMSIFETLILGRFLYDINAQPNLFHRSFLKLIINPPSDFSFDLYIYYIARINRYSIIRFPVLFPRRIYGESKWNTSFKSKYKFIKRTIDFSFKLKNNLKTKYDNNT